jgi:prevent-host-death family protein
MTKDRVKVASLRSDLADIINRVRFHNSRVVVVRHGEPVAAMVSMEDLAELERYRSMYTNVSATRPAA